MKNHDSLIEKIMKIEIISTLTIFNISYDDNQNNQIFMNSKTIVHVFYDKTKFIKFYNCCTNKKLKCKNELIAIQK